MSRSVKSAFIPLSKSRMSTSLFSLMVVSMLLAIYSSYMILDEFSVGDGWATSVAIVTLVWVVCYFTFTYFHYKSVYLFSSTYVLCQIIFHLNLILQKGFGVDLGGWGEGSFGELMELAGWYSVLSLCCFGVGIAISPLFIKTKYVPTESSVYRQAKVRKAVFWSGVGLVVASIVMFCLAVASYGNLLSYSRHEIFSSSADSRGFGLFTMLAPGAAALLLIGSRTRVHYIVAGFFAAFLFLIFVLSGYRSAGLFAAMAGVIAWVRSGRNLPNTLALCIAFVAVVAVSVGGTIRKTGSYGEINAEKLSASLENTSIDAVSSLGGTVGLVAHTIKFVPAEEDYRYGRSYLRAILGMIPNIGFKVDGGSSRAAAKAAGFTEDVLLRMAPSDWITYKILPEQFDLGFGTGYSGVAEPYLNFGFFGVVFYFLFLGVVSGVFESKDMRYCLIPLIFGAGFYRFLLPTVRNDFSNFLKPLAFTLIVLFIWWLVSKYFLGKRFSEK